MDFKNAIIDAKDIVLLNEKSIKKVSKDKDGLLIGIIIIAIGALIGAITSYYNGSYTAMANMGFKAASASSSIILSPIIAIILSFIGVGILFLFAKMFGGKGGYMELFKPLAYVSILSWLDIFKLIPFLGGLVGFAALIWSVVATIMVVKYAQKLTTGKAVAAVLIPAAIIAVIIIIIGIFIAMIVGAAMGQLFAV